jgi:ferrous iron transport protein A
MSMGFLEGSMAEIVHEAPFGGDPLAIRVRGTLLALRRHEANTIEVIVEESVDE